MIGSIRIKEATIEDLIEIWVLEGRCFRDQALSLDELHGLYQSLTIKVFIARAPELLGYAIGGMTGESGKLWGKLYSLGVHPSARGTGIGFKLLEALEAWFGRLGAAFPELTQARQAKRIELYRKGGSRIVLPVTEEDM